MIVDPTVLDLHADLAAEALEGAAFQCVAAARFLRRGDNAAAIETYRRLASIHKEFIAPEMRVLTDAAPDPLITTSAEAWRDERSGRSGGKAA